MARKYIFLICLLCFYQSAVFAESYFNQHAIGWHWYAQEESMKKSEKTNPSHMTASAQLQALQEKIKEAKAMAVLYPTDANILAYIRLQNALSAQASLFANNWQGLIRRNPAIDFSLQAPTNQAAKAAQADSVNQADEALLKKAAKSYGLFFFFEGKCPYCQRLAPILKASAARYGFSVLAISLDGLPLAQYPDFQNNQGQAEALGVHVYPSVYLVSAKNKTLLPVTFGLVSEVAFKQRLINAVSELNAHAQ